MYKNLVIYLFIVASVFNLVYLEFFKEIPKKTSMERYKPDTEDLVKWNLIENYSKEWIGSGENKENKSKKEKANK